MGPNLTASNTHFSGNFDYQETNQNYQDDFFEDNYDNYQGGNQYSNHQKHSMGGNHSHGHGHNQYGGHQRGRQHNSYRYDDQNNNYYNSGGNNYSHNMDRLSPYGERNNSQREEVVNFSLNYRHLTENNPENFNVIMILQLKLYDRKGIRILIYQYDNTVELVERVMIYLN